MVLDGLKRLYGDMMDREETRSRFIYTVNGVQFDVFFFIDEQPFKLLLITYKHNLTIDLDVKKGFWINPKLNQTSYFKLTDVIYQGRNSGSTLKTSEFFQQLNRNIPDRMGKRVASHEVPKQYYRNIEEADKRYYCGSKNWGHNNPNGDVTPENLEKTKRLLGLAAYTAFEKHRISSCWTDDPTRAKPFDLDEAAS